MQGRQRERRVGPATSAVQPALAQPESLPAQERATPVGASLGAGLGLAPTASLAPLHAAGPAVPLDSYPCGLSLGLGTEPAPLDLEVTVLAFAQWVTELKARQTSSYQQVQAELSVIRNSIASNHTELTDVKRHGAAIQQQMQSEINEIRESLSNVFMEITAAVRNNAGADQELKLKIQSLNEQAVRNETAFAQLADAADQSQIKLRNAVQEMQRSSERMRDELLALTRQADGLESTVTDRTERISNDMDQFHQDVRTQLERRKEQLRKMINDVATIGESLQNLVNDLSEQRRVSTDAQSKLQSSIYVLDQVLRKDTGSVSSRNLQAQQRPNGTAAQVSLPAGLQPGLQPGLQVRPTQSIVYR